MIQFVSSDAQQITNEMIAAYEAETGQVLYPGDPRRIYLLQIVPLLVAAKNDINWTGNQNLLPYAQGGALDALGSLVGATRLVDRPAQTTMRFTLSSVQASDIYVPAGTRITPDGEVFFATAESLIIAAGDTYGDVTAECMVGGELYNGLVPGQINIIVDPIAFVASASNTITSSGGSDKETDDAYRERIQLAPSSFSVAGPGDAYIYHAKSADVNIVDVSVTSPAACEVNLYVLLKNGGIPDEDMLDKVDAAVSADDVRPLTDEVSVLAPTVVEYDITLTYYISEDRSSEVTAIRAAIENTGGAIDQYVEWQQSKLGRAVTPDNLLAKMYAAGAARITVTDPVYSAITADKVAKLDVKTITYGGLI
jgi:phage-related baseplate assembly protein